MDNRDCLMLKTLKEEKSISKTAELLSISQPSLSYRIKNLEREFGVKLLDRHSNGVSFTLNGDLVLNFAIEMLEKLELVKQAVNNLNDSFTGELRLGVSGVIAKYEIAKILKHFRRLYPELKIIIKIGESSHELPEMLSNNEVDLIIRRGNMIWGEHKHVISKEYYGIISATPINYENLSNLPLITYDTNIIEESYEVFYDWWIKEFSAEMTTNIIRVNSHEACIQMVVQEFGWAVMPELHLKHKKTLHFKPLIYHNGRGIFQKTYLVYKDIVVNQPEVKAFIDFILGNYANLV